MLRTDVKMKLEMMRNDVMRELGELQWYHKEDLGGVVSSMQKQQRDAKLHYESKMESFRTQLEQEYSSATERLTSVHELEKQQLKLDHQSDKEEAVNRLKSELVEEQMAHRSLRDTHTVHREGSERELAQYQAELATHRKELDEARLAHTEAKLEAAAHHGEEDDRHLVRRRLPHLHQAPRPREDALCGENDEHVRLVHALVEERAQVDQVVGVEVRGSARHAPQKVG